MLQTLQWKPWNWWQSRNHSDGFSVLCEQSVVFYIDHDQSKIYLTANNSFSAYPFARWFFPVDFFIGCDKSNFVLTISSDSGIIKVNWHKNVHHYYLLLWKSLPIELFFWYLNSLITNLMWEVIITSYVVFTFCNLQIQNTLMYHMFDSLTWLCPEETDLRRPFWWLTVIFH